ncbi:MAG: leucine-rich repeat domain-containing protein [Flavobacteriales bacterium]|nr:leucine-rich repeat domain-containing protein [Flavobacteriales bacterium]MBP9081399.1 leucine-rich repeat domain-containing protein [Flavobacteriales bacterium]
MNARICLSAWALGVLGCLASSPAQAQLLPQAALDSARTFRSMEVALQQPDSVYRLDLSGRKLKAVPEEVRLLKNLNALDLGRNKLKALPGWMNELQYVQEFSAGRNRFSEVPNAVCQWKHLKRLDMHRNHLEGLPACMGNLKALFSLDLWSNDLGDFPEAISGMQALRFLDLRAIQFSPKEMEHIADLLPAVKIFFSQPCNCGE